MVLFVRCLFGAVGYLSVVTMSRCENGYCSSGQQSGEVVRENGEGGFDFSPLSAQYMGISPKNSASVFLCFIK